MVHDSNNSNGHAENNLQKIDAIRDIIFGQSMAEIDNKFSSLEKLIAKQNRLLKASIEKIDKKLNDTTKLIKEENKKSQKLNRETTIQELEALSEKMKRDMNALSKRIILQREKLDKNIRKTQTEFNSVQRTVDTKMATKDDQNDKKLLNLFKAIVNQLEK